MIITYFGADAGCGCTMLAQGTANYAAEQYPDKKILLLSLGGFVGCDYAECTFDYCLDDLQIKLQSNVLAPEELVSMCAVRKNLYMLQGSRDLQRRKEYMPEDIEKLMALAEKSFDHVIVDGGCSVDLGIGLGALIYGGTRILVVNQSQRAFERHMQKAQVFLPLGIQFDRLLINRFVSRHFLPAEKTIRESYQFSQSSVVIEYSDYGMQAEEDHMALDHLDKAYKQQSSVFFKTLFQEPMQVASVRKGLGGYIKQIFREG